MEPHCYTVRSSFISWDSDDLPSKRETAAPIPKLVMFGLFDILDSRLCACEGRRFGREIGVCFREEVDGMIDGPDGVRRVTSGSALCD